MTIPPLPPLDPIDNLLERLTWRSAFGEPTQHDDTTLIPVSDVNVAFGYGHGFGSQDTPGGPASATLAQTPQAASGGGGGVGGRGSVTPRGYIRISADGVKYEPTVDVNRMFLLLFPMIAWNIFWIARTIRAYAPHAEEKA